VQIHSTLVEAFQIEDRGANSEIIDRGGQEDMMLVLVTSLAQSAPTGFYKFIYQNGVFTCQLGG